MKNHGNLVKFVMKMFLIFDDPSSFPSVSSAFSNPSSSLPNSTH